MYCYRGWILISVLVEHNVSDKMILHLKETVQESFI